MAALEIALLSRTQLACHAMMAQLGRHGWGSNLAGMLLWS